MRLNEIFDKKCVIPVVNFEKLHHVEPVVEALNEHGYDIIEITLRNEISMHALELAVKKFPDTTIAAGTLKSVFQIDQIRNSGAKFAFTPGIQGDLLGMCQKQNLSVIPGISNASDAILVEQFGIEYVKLFPASILGGTSYIKALGGPFPNLKFCPTGGVNNANKDEYFELKNCFAVGGSWLTPEKYLRNEDWIGLSDFLSTT
ncbi:MAG: bifunctional 4-hydroxy-2-oxoglutarate aldolase/2-dehydro-3-deoxy-phosphogluconate aldolase [Alphaproteobacteria bacterium]|nr:bifunctional 4-hydroxy-2-oxoglutarate aldolase/2-dehydro-3-deoxy-phosphogluconate aldolase [Alphaproteobacteria bacterium]